MRHDQRIHLDGAHALARTRQTGNDRRCCRSAHRRLVECRLSARRGRLRPASPARSLPGTPRARQGQVIRTLWSLPKNVPQSGPLRVLRMARGRRRWRCIGRNIVVLRLAAPTVDVGQRANRREVLWSGAQHLFKLGRRFVVGADLDERAAERDPRRNVGGVPQESGAAGVDGVAELPEAAILLGERREGYRRRVPLDPAPQFFQSARCRS